jgi:hypothetical protein
MPLVGFELTISAGERPQIYALDRAATGTGFVPLLLSNIPRNRSSRCAVTILKLVTETFKRHIFFRKLLKIKLLEMLRDIFEAVSTCWLYYYHLDIDLSWAYS